MSGNETGHDRERRRNQIGVGSGLTVGATMGIVAGFLVFGVDRFAAAAVLAAVGALCGAVVGRLVVGRVVADDWEPLPSGRSFVGLQAPDADGRAGSDPIAPESEPRHALGTRS